MKAISIALAVIAVGASLAAMPALLAEEEPERVKPKNCLCPCECETANGGDHVR